MKVYMKLSCDRCGKVVELHSFDEVKTTGWHTVLLRPFMSDDSVPDGLLGEICDICSDELVEAMKSPHYSFKLSV